MNGRPLRSTNARRLTELSDRDRRHTAWIWGKPYHWELTIEGYLTLKPGISEWEQIRVAVFEKLLEKGVPQEKISHEMVEAVVAQAEDAAIREGVGIE